VLNQARFGVQVFGQFLIFASILAAIGVAGWLGMKSWNKPRDMSKYTQAPGTFSSVVDKVDDADESNKKKMKMMLTKKTKMKMVMKIVMMKKTRKTLTSMKPL